MNRLDTRSRVLATIALVGTLVALDSLPALGVAVGLALLGIARFHRLPVWRRLFHIEGFMLLLLASLPFTTPGSRLFSIGPFAASREGLLLAMAVVLRVNACFFTILLLLGPVDSVRLGHALARLGAPLRLVHLFLFSVRYLAIFRAETERLMETLRARAFVPRSNFHTWRTYGNLTGMMLVRSLERAERVDEAMRCRAFHGRFLLVQHEAFSAADLALAAATLAVSTTLLLAERFG